MPHGTNFESFSRRRESDEYNFQSLPPENHCDFNYQKQMLFIPNHFITRGTTNKQTLLFLEKKPQVLEELKKWLLL